MSKKTFIISNSLILIMGVLGFIFPKNILAIIVVWSLFNAISFILVGIKALNKKARYIVIGTIAAFIILAQFGDNIFGIGLNLVFSLVVLAILGFEVYIHAVTAIIQKNSKLKTWPINATIGIMILGLFLIILFDTITRNSARNQTPIADGWMIFFGICSTILIILSSYYFFYLYKNKTIPGSLSVFNLNKKHLTSANLPKEFYLSVKNATPDELEQIVKKNTSGEFIEGQEYITVYIHAWKPAIDMMGHADIVYQKNSYSLSNYDVENGILGGMASTGVISITPEEQYRDYCMKYQGKVLLAYSIPITKEQFLHVQGIVDLFIKDSKEWMPEDMKKNKAARNIMKRTDAKLRIVTKGEFKNYFALGTNCVKLVDVVLNDIGYETKVSKNLLTPGEYMKYFEEISKDENRRIVKRMYW